jgi:hypothetical protein
MAATTMDKAIGRLRKFLRDIDELNKLLDRKESSDSQLQMAIEDSLDDWNNTPPLLNVVTLDTHPSKRLLIRGAAIEVLTSAGILYSRNRLSYSDGGITVSVSDKAQEYSSWIGGFVNDYERKKTEHKKAINIAQAWGGVNSEYLTINSRDYTW